MNNNFYVYAILDPRKPGKYIYGDYSFNYEPFYVGKGGNYDRFKLHLNESYTEYDKKFVKGGNFRCCKIRKIKKETKQDPIFMKIEENISEKDSLKLEVEIIKSIGRIDLNQGPLTNLTDGGEGTSGLESWIKGKHLSEEHKKNMRGKIPWNKGKHLSEEHKRNISGRIPWNKGLKTGPQSEETCRKMKGRIPWNKGLKTGSQSEETKIKRSKSMLNKNKGKKTEPKSEEHKRKLSKAKKEYWRKLKRRLL